MWSAVWPIVSESHLACADAIALPSTLASFFAASGPGGAHWPEGDGLPAAQFAHSLCSTSNKVSASRSCWHGCEHHIGGCSPPLLLEVLQSTFSGVAALQINPTIDILIAGYEEAVKSIR